MANQYNSDKKTLGELLSLTSPTILVPEWQRNYSWDSTHVETFWQDINKFSDSYPSTNIAREEYFLGSIVLVNNPEGNLLLDGQQRLATSTILLSVIRDMLVLFSQDASTRTQAKWIKDTDDATQTDSYKLTLNRFDQTFFKSEVQDMQSSSGRPTPEMRSHTLIAGARDFFRARFDEKYDELHGGKAAYDWALRIRQVLTDHMSVVVVSSTDEDNAAAVFETLNDRGIGLSTPDLLRNLILRRSTTGSQERIIEYWQSIYDIEEVSGRVDEFLRHYWLSKRGDVKTRSLYREMKSIIETENIDSLELSKEMAEAANLYKDIVNESHDDADIRRSLKSINELGAKSLYPVILSCLAVVENIGEQQQLLNALVIFYVRHSVIGNKESTVLERVVYDIAQKLREAKDVASAIAALVTASPSDGEFTEQFARTTIRRVTSARYILKEIEHYKRITGEVGVETPDRVHIEHIYPQTPPEDRRWENHEKYVGRLGNLTLLARRLNESLKNADFAIKKEKYSESDLLITKELLVLESWDPAAIDRRQEELSQLAANIWKY